MIGMFTNFDFKTSSIFSVPSPYVSILDELHSGQALETLKTDSHLWQINLFLDL